MIVRAAVDGVVDFTKADLRNPLWHRRLSIIVGEMLRRDRLKSLERLHTRLLAYLPTRLGSVQEFNKLAEEETEVINDFLGTLAGRTKPTGSRKVEAAKALRDAWNREFGDSSKADVQQNIDQVAEALRQMRLARRQPK